jgi:co-chaperonin GroES (HSP10)
MPEHADLSPLQNNLLLRPCRPVDRIGVIIVPEAHQKKLNQGVVMEKGPLCSDAIQIDDIVFFAMHTEHQLGYGGESFTIVAEESCLGRIRKSRTPDCALVEE